MKKKSNTRTKKAAAAGQPKTDRFTQAKQRLASSPNTSPDVLAKLSRKEQPELLERVAENPQTEPGTLKKLAAHENSKVRSAVSENQNVTPATLESLAGDNNPDVRFRLAENPHIPETILQSLTEDDNPYVSVRAQDTLKMLKSTAEQADEALLKERYPEAEDLYKNLLTNLQKLLGADHQEVAKFLHKLAAALAAQGKQAEALEAEQRVNLILAAYKKG